MTREEFEERFKAIRQLPSGDRVEAARRLSAEFHSSLSPQEREIVQHRFRRSVTYLVGTALGIALGVGACVHFLSPDAPPELRTSEGISVSTCMKIQARGCQAGDVDDCALDCTATSESLDKLSEWYKKRQGNGSSGR